MRLEYDPKTDAGYPRLRIAAVASTQEIGPACCWTWLPGVGHFLWSGAGTDRPPLIGGPLRTLAPHPEIHIKPQARTRGLPRLRPPGVATDQHTRDHACV